MAQNIMLVHEARLADRVKTPQGDGEVRNVSEQVKGSVLWRTYDIKLDDGRYVRARARFHLDSIEWEEQEHSEHSWPS